MAAGSHATLREPAASPETSPVFATAWAASNAFAVRQAQTESRLPKAMSADSVLVYGVWTCIPSGPNRSRTVIDAHSMENGFHQGADLPVIFMSRCFAPDNWGG